MSRVLIFTAHSGGGHVSLADALRDRLPADAIATIVDPLPRAANIHYRLVSRHALGLWAAEFRATDTPARARAIHRLLAVLLRRRLGALLDEHQPDLVLSTCAVLNDATLGTLARRRHHASFAMLIADANQLHATWLTAQQSAATLAPTHESYQEALDAGFAPARLHLTGWPVRSQFYRAECFDPAALRVQLQLDAERFTVFVQGGGEGAAHLVCTVESLLDAGVAQVILAAGANRALRERFDGVAGVRAIPFTREIAPLMAAADVVLGKAGPNMLFESVMLGKPFVATTYIPGQETGNLALIERYGLGWVALDAREQHALLASLANDSGRLAAMAATVQRYRTWNAAAAESIGPLLSDLCRAGVPAPGRPWTPTSHSANVPLAGG